jgi:putative membrane protein
MNKPWDGRLAALLVRPLQETPVHPNHLTTLGLATGLSAAWLYARGGASADVGGVLLVATMIIDHGDGELARATGKTSSFGHAYDRTVDLIVKLGTFVGMGLGLRHGSLGGWAVVLGASAGAALLAIFNARSALARRRPPAEAFYQPAFAGFEIEDILYLIAPLTWLGLLPGFLLAAGIGAPLFAGWSVFLLWRAVAADRDAGRTVRTRTEALIPSAVRPGLAIGLALFCALLLYVDLGDLVGTLRRAGAGLLLVAAFHLIPLAGDALGWRTLLDPAERPPFVFFLRARWIGESVNGLLPVLQIGGNVVKARLLAAAGVPGPRAGASVVVDVTTLMAAQLAFTLLGIALFAAGSGATRLVAAIAAGAGLMTALALGFVAAQRAGAFGRGARVIARVAGGVGGGLALDAASLDGEVRSLHTRHRRLVESSSWHLAAWVAGAGEVWLALYFLGHPVDLWAALLLESLGQAVRAAAFAVPGALGVQEGGFVVLGAVLGIDADTCLALSLAKRARELILGVPGLVSWQSEPAHSVFGPRPTIAAPARKAS